MTCGPVSPPPLDWTGRLGWLIISARSSLGGGRRGHQGWWHQIQLGLRPLPPCTQEGAVPSAVASVRPASLSEPLLTWARGTCTHAAQGWARSGAPPRGGFGGSSGGLPWEPGSPPGPAWLWPRPSHAGRSRQSSGLNILGGQAGWNKLPFQGELYLFADASRAPAIRNFIGSSDLGLATSCQWRPPPGRAPPLGQPCPGSQRQK